MDRSGCSRRDFLRHALQAGLALSPLGLAGCGGGSGAAAPGAQTGTAPTLTGYKALVCVFLRGGNDGFNTIVPLTQEKYDRYAAVRGALAVPRAQLLPLSGAAGDGATYGLHPRLGKLRTLFNGGRAAIVSNVGSLRAPVSQADFLAGRNLPARLFSHNDQQDQWASAAASGGLADGWAGRIGDVLGSVNAGAALPLNLSIAGTNLWQAGRLVNPLTVSPSGPGQLVAMNTALRGAYLALQALPAEHPFEREYQRGHQRGIQMHAVLKDALARTPALATAFPANSAVAAQLALVARIIAARGSLLMRRQTFFVQMGNWDTHDGQALRHPQLLQQLSEALDAFYAATVELGVATDVTAFTASDFGRSLTVNGKGTDHGWSSHHFAIGGAVRGGLFHGDMPSLEPGAADDTRGGRFIPSMAVDEYAASLVRWFGVADRELGYVLPNLDRFATRGPALFG